MKRSLMVAVAMALVAGPAIADESTYDTVVRKYGEAYAIADICPSLEINAGRMAIYLVGLGIELDEAFKSRVLEQVAVAKTTLGDTNRYKVCTLGHMLYGESGTNAPGLLKVE
ncbi:hypothetical protein [Hoeflea sp. EC-HK425]|uniref:hypothetical protein n=1 Tax=Hoeflea sp. EC-HK425 TaxID=2038388 RepID=UPI0012548E52|nr:hypothetical protein [Hoeflea sp. EC-HK425]VVT15360.1 conserved exported hypothetical protein [Hoeflea sp. EC-HK425]